MATINVQALAELKQSILDQGIVDPFVFNSLVQTEDPMVIRFLDVTLAEYCKNANKTINLAKTQVESQEPRYAHFDNMLEKLEVASLGISAKKIHTSIRPVRLCLAGDPEDLDVAKFALRSLERDYLVFESQLENSLSYRNKCIYLMGLHQQAHYQESSMQGEFKGNKH